VFLFAQATAMADRNKDFKATEVDDTLPWIEKYRPSCLDDLVSHTEILKTGISARNIQTI